MKKITQKLTKSIWQSGLFAMAFLFSLSINSQDLALQGVGDINVGGAGFSGNDGKFIHLVANADIADLSIYGLGSANNGGGTDGIEFTFDAVSVSSGDHIMVLRNVDAMTAWLGADVYNTFALAVVSSVANGNGNDAIELFMNGDLTSVEVYGDLEFEGGSGNYDFDWAYTDSWAYKNADGTWNTATPNCTDGSSTSLTSDCPYPYLYTPSGCGETVTYSQVANGDYTESVTAPAGQNASVTINGDVENGYDFISVTDGAGTVLNPDQTTGVFTDAVFTSTDGTVSVNITNDASIQNGDVTLAFACADPTFNVIFSVNTANITVGENGMYAGGGVLGGANAYAMTDDGTGTWTVTVALAAGTSGNYIFLNSPTSDSDWATKENLSGQECSDPNNYDDRILAEVTADTTLLHCFGSCETDGTCSTPTFNVTFSVNTANITVGENGMYAGGGVLGGANAYAMTDDGTGTWTVTVALNEGTAGNYIFLNSPTSDSDWGTKEDLAGQECADAGNYNDRILAAVTADTTLLHCFGNCASDGTCIVSAACGVTVTYTQVANGDYTETVTAPAGQTASVTVNGDFENNYDFLFVTDGAGNALNADQTTGVFTDAVFTSTDGTVSVNITNDSSVQNGDVTLAFACAASTFDVTFSVNTANITVGELGMYVGGGVLGGANAYAMTDDGTGTWTVTVALAAGTTGNYTLLNSPTSDSDWGAKEDISGQECADAANYNDRILAEVTADTTLLHCFGTCDTDGTCSVLAVDSFPYCSSFDADLGDWTAESVSGDVNWSSAAENYNGSVVPLTGAGMAYIYAPSGVANLVSTVMDITSLASPQVTFSFAQPSWAGDQDELRVWYKAAAGDEWSQLAEYTADTPAWETVTLDLPNASNDYYIAFNGTAGYGYGLTIDDVCVATAGVSNDELLAFLGSGTWRSDAETAGHIGVGPSGSTSAEWWNANPYDKADTGLYDDRWSFADGVLTVDTGDDGAIFGKKAEIDAAFPDNTAYDADNSDNEYLYYTQDDYTDTFEVDATNNTITFATNGNLGFFTSVAGQEFQILESTDNTVYVRNVGSEGNAWYNRLTTADALSTVDAMVLDMRIYPNPSNGSYVTIQTPINGVKYVEVFDITGKRLINTSLSADTLDVSSMSSGMYLVKVTIEGQSKTSKLIIR